MKRVLSLLAVLCISQHVAAGGEPMRVKISPGLESVVVRHGEKLVTVARNQDPEATINPVYAKTSRDCPPYCIQPIVLAPGVETIGELELLEYLRRSTGGEEDILVIDSRKPGWLENGTIPGSVNIPWTTLSPAAGADPFEIADTLERRFGAISQEGLWNFTDAKTLVLFCNGMWCGQSPANIRTLLNFGYPAHKLKWYRGGMQAWEALGLTTVH
jgi:rhodanese-related sulfurtransferase